MARGLSAYHAKRDFGLTPEPQGLVRPRGTALHYAMQCHDATRLHWDLRLEWEGVLLSWAVTRGPSLDPEDKRLAVRTEDHPLDYLDFEGVIPKGGYGAGTSMLWDIGSWSPTFDAAFGLDKGHLRFRLHGLRLTGEWHLVRIKGKPGERAENWLLIKQEDAAANGPDPVARWTTSALTNRDLPQIAAGAPPRPFGPPRKAPAPAAPPPMLPTLEATPPTRGDWWTELKFDGYRATVALGAGGARVFTRSGADWTDRFAPLLPALEALPARTALIDGEIVAGADQSGFGAIQQAVAEGGPFRFFAFDLLHRDGTDLRERPLRERRAALEALLADAVPLGLVQASTIIPGDGAAVLAPICEAGGEGIVCKLADSPWRSGRATSWVKVKCQRRAEFVVVGWQPSETRGRPFASLLLATREGGAWVYRGKVGTGFDDATMADLAARLAPLRSDRRPLAETPAEVRRPVWVRPALVVEVRYAETTEGGRLRHAAFLGLREDKPATEVIMDEPKGERVPVAGISLSSPARVMFPPDGPTKLDLARYYAAIAPRMLATARERPLALLRLPEGLGGPEFFQKHLRPGWPDAILPVEDGAEPALMVRDAAGLVGCVQMGTVEFHLWGAKADRLEAPDRLVFDLDPDTSLGWPEVQRAAVDLRDVLAGLGLASWPMVTGGKGVHVIVPLRRSAGWETVKLFARTVATHLAEQQPQRFVATMSKARREGRIFIDWLRNERGATAIAPFSVRARPGAPVAMPVSWDRLATLPGANAFGMAEALAEGDWEAVGVPKPQGLTSAIAAMQKAWG